ncbi:MAG: exosortase/archaeosortase family protein, partial [Candidatus Rokubacteria bacterium]|nr:exosortase/archaeosortase family protein [Candidatus Rokubacteria bacterium]
MTQAAAPGWRVPRGVLLAAGLVFVAYRHLLPGVGPAPPPVESWVFSGPPTPPGLGLLGAALLALARLRNPAPRVRPRPGAGALLLVVSASIFGWARLTGARDLCLVSLGCLALAALLLVRGGAGARALAPSLLLLACSLPLPGVLANEIVHRLQLQTAGASAWLLDLAGRTALVEGDTLALPGHTVEVIETCSGLGPMRVLLLLGVTYVTLVRVPRTRAALLLAASAPIAFATNAARVAAVAARPGGDLSQLHLLQGLAVFLAGTLLLVLVDRVLESVWSTREPGPPDAERRSAARAQMPAPLLVTLSALAVLSLAPPWP